ncbi:MAG: permease-like cell division protein FtsX [Patescibacteria group bacterium]|jgi:cell division transport system permease protein|nr:permease-like cell division protein FtsX [Patescibacteria group bacterium]
MILSLLRAIKFSVQDFYRNIWLSLVTIIIIVLALFSVNMLLTVKVIGDTAVLAIKDKIDVSLFLNTDATEESVFSLKTTISTLAQVEEITYISKDEALADFKEKNKSNPELLESLKQLGKNPLTPTLVIKPKNIDHLDELIANLNKIEDPIIESRNFTNYKLMLNKINGITDKVSEAGILISMIFVFITLLVVYNSVRVAIYTHKTEIAVMKLVGASNSFVYLPYVFSALIYTIVGLLIIMLIFYPFLTLLQPYLATFFIGYNINIVSYFTSNVFQIFGLQFLVASTINVGASLIAVKKYANV